VISISCNPPQFKLTTLQKKQYYSTYKVLKVDNAANISLTMSRRLNQAVS